MYISSCARQKKFLAHIEFEVGPTEGELFEANAGHSGLVASRRVVIQRLLIISGFQK